MTKATYPATIGGRVRFERQRLCMSEGELARLAGVSSHYVPIWEADRDVPDFRALLGLALGGVDVQFVVVGWTDERAPSGGVFNANSPAVRDAFAAVRKLPIDVRQALLHIWLQQDFDA
ncbi:MAG: hypothetical protein WCY29_07240 [Novosphingobium sp.]